MEDGQTSEFEPGHEWLYRLTALSDDKPPETRYFLSPFEVKGWRDRLQLMGYRTDTSSIPAAAFGRVDDTHLDMLAEQELAATRNGNRQP